MENPTKNTTAVEQPRGSMEMSMANSLRTRLQVDSGPRRSSDIARPPANSQQQETHEHHGRAQRLRGGGAAKVCYDRPPQRDVADRYS